MPSLSRSPRSSTRSRPPSKDYVLKRAAIDAVSTTRDKLGLWQARSIHLLTIGQHLRARGHHQPHYAEEALILWAAVEREKVSFVDATDGLPSEVKAHGVVIDTARALGDISARLDEALKVLRSHP
jgi:hypothetical protein